MIEQLRQFHQCHICVFTCTLENFASECFSKSVSAEMFNLQIILFLYQFKQYIDTLRGINHLFLTDKTFLTIICDAQSVMALSDVLLKVRIDFNYSAFTCFLFIYHKLVIVNEYQISSTRKSNRNQPTRTYGNSYLGITCG